MGQLYCPVYCPFVVEYLLCNPYKASLICDSVYWCSGNTQIGGSANLRGVRDACTVRAWGKNAPRIGPRGGTAHAVTPWERRDRPHCQGIGGGGWDRKKEGLNIYMCIYSLYTHICIYISIYTVLLTIPKHNQIFVISIILFWSHTHGGVLTMNTVTK